MSARERLERLECAETLAARTADRAAQHEAEPAQQVTATLVRGELLVDSPEMVYHDQRCRVCLETFAVGLRERCVAVLSCHHAICSACLVDYRMQTRRYHRAQTLEQPHSLLLACHVPRATCSLLLTLPTFEPSRGKAAV